MKYLVTVKLAKNSKHDPRNKVTGPCPIIWNGQCSDVTGEHHSFIVSRDNLTVEGVRDLLSPQFHVTRVEELPGLGDED